MEQSPAAPEFEYRHGEMHAEAVPLARIAAEVGTPFYCYSTAALTRGYRSFAAALAGLEPLICYAVKANGNLAVIRTFAELGAGADVVSEGELRRALAAGVPANKIVFSGVGKTRGEMVFALETGIRQLNIESIPELEALGAVVAETGHSATIAVRVNPDVDARTHEKITTGTAENKFGIDLALAGEVFTRAAALPGVEPVGLAVHIGSQLLDLDPYRRAFAKVAELVAVLRADGHEISRLDLGGGLGITYDDEAPPSIEAYAAVVQEVFSDLGCELVVEPGRLLTGNAGLIATRVIYVKQGQARRFVIVDAAMNDLKRPTMYDAHHAILPIRQPAAGATAAPVDVVGPICETGDRFATARPLPPVADGDLLAICSAGAYGAVMSSTYNGRPLIPEVLVNEDRFAVVRPRPTYEELLAQDRLPDWFSAPSAGRERGAA